MLRRFDYFAGNLAAVSDAAGATTRFGYDDRYRIVSWTDSVGASYANTYDDQGRVVAQGGDGAVWAGRFSYVDNGAGVTTTYTNGDGGSTTYEFDADLRPMTVTSATGSVQQTEFNATRDPVRAVDPMGAATTISYTADGLPMQTVDPLGRVSTILYVSTGAGAKLAQLTDPAGAVVSYGYDAQQPAHTPSTEHSGTQERPTTDGSHTREPQRKGEGRQSEPASATPDVMSGPGMPMTSHTFSGAHTTPDSHTPANKTPSVESPARTPETKAPQTNPSDSSRGQTPGASGPAPGTTPSVPIESAARNTQSAPVNPAATQTLSGSIGESARPGSEQSSPRPGDGTRESATTHSGPHVSRDGSDQPGNQSRPGPGDTNAGAGNTPAQSPNDSVPKGNPADARVFGPNELDPVEDPAHQTAVENALRNADGNALVHADPRTNDYGHLINDGGPSVDGRSNNCIDCSLSALSSFLGESWPWVRTLLHSVFDQPHADSVAAQDDRIIDALADKLPNVADHLEGARADLLAFTAFPSKSGARSGRTTLRSDSLRRSAAAPTSSAPSPTATP